MAVEHGVKSEALTLRSCLASGLNPMLFALFPIASIYFRNLEELPTAAIVLPAILALVGILCLHLLFAVLFRRPWKTGLILSACLVPVFAYEWFFSRYAGYLSALFDPRARLAAWAIFTLCIAVALGFTRGIGPTHGRVLNRIALVLVLVAASANVRTLAARLTPSWGSDRGDAGRMAMPRPDEDFISSEGPVPDIYYILLDEYGREDVLRELYDFDNTPFLDALRERGFVIADDSYGHYNWTRLAVPTLLNLDYIHKVIDSPWTMKAAMDTVEDARVFRLAKRTGYEVIALLSGMPHLDQPLLKHAFRDGDTPNLRFTTTRLGSDLSQLLVKMTPLADLLHVLPVDDPGSRGKVRANLAALPQIASLAGATFTYMHVISPHPPFRYNSYGERRESPGGIWGHSANPDAWRGAYAEQVAGLNIHVLEAIDEVLAASAIPPVIVIQSDHGPRPKFVGIDLVERLGILTAVHLPEGGEGIYPSISPVNVMRFIVSEYFGYELPLLEDRSFYTAGQSPEDLREVTGLLDSVRIGGRRSGLRLNIGRKNGGNHERNTNKRRSD